MPDVPSLSRDGTKTMLRSLLLVPAILALGQTTLAQDIRPQEAPSLTQARIFLHQHTDVPCDDRDNPNLTRADRVELLSASGRVETRLYDLYCDNSGAQTTRVFLVWWSFDGRFRLLHFASPVFTFQYRDEAVRVELARPVSVTGFEALTALPEGKFDPATGTITSTTPWSLQGEAGTTGRWKLNHATTRFDLVSYTVDPYHESDLPPQQRPAWAGKSVRLFPFGP